MTLIVRKRTLALLAAGMLLGGLATHSASAQTAPSNIMADIVKRGTVRIATIAGNPPYSSVSPSGEPQGYDVEIGKLIAAALKVKPEWVIVDTPGRITALQTRRADITLANFTNTIERSTVIAFTRPYLIVGSSFMVKKDSPLQTAEQLNDPKYKVSGPRGGTFEPIAANTVPKATVLRFDTVQDALLALRSGQADANLGDSLQIAATISASNGAMRALPGNWSYEEIAVGLPAGDADWFRIMDAWVRQFNGSGDNARLFKKIFGFDMPPLQ
ncbi:MAG: transporter substrate-binding domain-containing protein [Alphaproteobacteria bacterium]|nr:transporter substrate-binding domain-containing protein [Alphaproteobacteria bacterium]